jgi:chromosome segregation ATPase
VEIGRRMCEAKKLLPHGEFGKWVKEQTGYSSSTANNFMRLYSEYSDQQFSIFGAEVNSQSIGNLPYSKALLLLSVPSEEREKFVEENNVSELSNSELKKALKERDEALEKVSALEGARDDIADALNHIKAENDKLKEENKELAKRPVDAVVTAVDKEEVEKAVAEALKAAAEEHKHEIESIQKKLDSEVKENDKLAIKIKEAEQKAANASSDAAKGSEEYKRQADEAKAEADKLRRELQMADPVTAEFKGIFEQTSVMVTKMIAIIKKASPQSAPKLKAALSALGKQLGGEINE